MTKKERNEKIGHMYKQGQTQAVIASRYKLTTARVGQILRELGILQPREGAARKAFTGVHMEESAKLAMKDVAERDGKSMSRFMSDLAVDELKRRGIAQLGE